jgi:hypothetical protein
VDVGERAEELVDVELDFQYWHDRLELIEVPGSTIDGLGDVFEDQVEIDFVFLWRTNQPLCHDPTLFFATYPVTVAVVEGLELNNVGMPDDSHDLEFSILQRVSPDDLQRSKINFIRYLEAFVLQDSLDGRIFAARRELRLENHAEGAVSDNLALCVSEISSLSSASVLDFFADDFCRGVSSGLATD